MKRNADGLLENPITGNFDIQRGRSGRFVSKKDEGRRIVGKVYRHHTYDHAGKCAMCGEQFYASKETRKYCSTKCRVAAARLRKRAGYHGLTKTHADKLRLLEKYAPKAATTCKEMLLRTGVHLTQYVIDIAFDVLMIHVDYLKKEQGKKRGVIDRLLGGK